MTKKEELFYGGIGINDYGIKYHIVGTEQNDESILGENGFTGDEKDAKLIAAAPIMYNALKELEKAYKEKGQLLAYDIRIALKALEYAEQ